MRLLLVAGARPNFMKVAPVMRELGARLNGRSGFEVMLVHTGQHYNHNMSEAFFRDLGIPFPDINLEVGSGTHAHQTARIMMAFEPVCIEHRPDWVIVFGDVNSTIACALTAKKLGIRVAHVEAGLRSHDWTMPEEINRRCTDCISDLHFTTDRIASENLVKEGVDERTIHFVGNTMIDTLRQHLEGALALPLPDGVIEREYAVMTLHRPGNVDSPEILQQILSAVNVLAERIPVVFPAHPRTLPNLAGMDLHPRVQLIEPLGYLNFLSLMARSRMVLTDSGGIQEETTMLKVPCLTLRPNTEWPITCEIGTNVLTGTSPARIVQEAEAILDGRKCEASVPEKWDGKASERLVDVLLNEGAGAIQENEKRREEGLENTH